MAHIALLWSHDVQVPLQNASWLPKSDLPTVVPARNGMDERRSKELAVSRAVYRVMNEMSLSRPLYMYKYILYVGISWVVEFLVSIFTAK